MININKLNNDINYKKLWIDICKHKKLLLWILIPTLILSALYNSGFTDDYKCDIKISPELDATYDRNYLLSLRNGGLAGQQQTTALFPSLYPVLMNSVEFRMGLLSIMVKTSDSGKEVSYYDYKRNYQKRAWWKDFLGEREYKEPDTINTFRLTLSQYMIRNSLERNILFDYNPKKRIITISVTDSDPLVCAILADSVKEHLQQFITNYSINKAKDVVEYYKKIQKIEKRKYEEATYRYASYMDSNRDVFLKRILSEQNRLENEMQIAYDTYSQVTTQLIKAEQRLQRQVPAFFTIQSATVPVKESGPIRSLMVLKDVLYVLILVLVYVFYKEHDFANLLGVIDKHKVS